MNNIETSSNVTEASFSAVITHADGTVEDLGVISYYHRNRWRMWLWEAKQRRKLLLTKLRRRTG